MVLTLLEARRLWGRSLEGYLQRSDTDEAELLV